MRTQNSKRDIDYRFFYGLVIVMVLLLNVIANNALGDGVLLCSPCDSWGFDGYTWRCMGQVADCGKCYACNTSTTPPSYNYKCDVNNCKECFLCTEGCRSYCYTSQCQTCDGHGNCPVCDGNEFKLCCNGTCYDTRTQGCCNSEIYDKSTQKCCEDTATPYPCAKNGSCCYGSCCGSTQCCDTAPVGPPGCVLKCKDGGTCPHDTPHTQAMCDRQSPTNFQCIPDQVGATCQWVVVYEYSSSAECALCAPGCGRAIDPDHPYCAFYKAETCRNALIIGCTCNYKGDEGARPTYGSGNHYVCN